MQKKSFKVAGLFAVLLSVWMEADAAGLGRLTVQSALGQPLKAEIELYSVTKDELPSISAKLASADAFRQARIERQESLIGLRFSVDQRQNGQPIVRISSSAPITDPFLDLLIELNWASGRLLREYTLLLDLPVEAKPTVQQEPPAQPAPPIMAAPVEAKPAPAKPAEPAKKPAKEPAKEEAKAEKPMDKEYGPIQKGETLRAIAIKLRPQGASTEQMMVGLFQANKEAFFNDNMNLMKKGEVLKVPDFENLMLMASPSQARKMVSEQTAAWRAGQDKSAGAEASKDKAAAAGKVEAAKPDAKPDAAAPKKDVLKLSKGEPVAGAASAERQRAMEEDLAAKSRALKEAQERVAHLEKTVKDLQRLAELKSEEKAAASEAKPAVPAVPVEAAKPEPKPEAKPAPAPAPAPVPELSLIDEILGNPLYLGGGLAGILLLALVGIKLSRARKEKSEPASVGGLAGSLFDADESAAVAVGATAAAAAGATPTHQDSGVLTDFSRLGLGAIDTQEIDPIAEAEVYLAYGKEAQAEEILRDALAKNPDREDVLLKLLEIYHARKDIATFEASARNLQTAVGGDTSNASWVKAAEMGRDIDPNNPLYAMAEVAADMGAIESAVPEPISELDIEIPEMESLEMPSEPEPVVEAAPEAPASVLPMGLDFEFSMEMPGDEKPAAEPEPQAMSEEMPSLDFPPEMAATPEIPEAAGMEASLELPTVESETIDELPPLDLGESAQEIEGLEAMPTPAESEEISAEELPDLDFGGMEEESAAPATEASSMSEEAGLPDLDFGGLDLELGAPVAEAEPVQEMETASVEAELPDLDIGSLDFAAEEPAQEIAQAEEAGPADLGLELNDLEMTMEQAQDATTDEPIDIQAPMSESEELSAEVNTKLDLARAYIEMGDKEGAREILEEVLKEGSGPQIEEANKLMAEAS